MINKICAWFQCVDGATAIEYALIAGGISLAIVASVLLFGGDLRSLFETVAAPMNEIATEAETPG